MESAGTWAFENHPMTHRLAKAAINHFAKDSRFATHNESEIRAGSVGSSHCNHLLSAVKQEKPCSTQSIVCNGVYDKKKFFGNDDFKDAADGEGVWWWCIRWEIDEEFPIIAHIFQAALNTSQHVAEGDSRVYKHCANC